jgi:hypothetical protein
MRTPLSGFRLGVAVVTLCCICAAGGCVISDPVLPDLAVRADSGVLTFGLPICPQVVIESAQVLPYSAQTVPPPIWTAKQFLGDPRGIVKLDPSSWAASSGTRDFQNLEDFEVDFFTTSGPVATRVASIAKNEGLGDGNYQVGNSVMSFDEYRRKIDKELHCPSPTGHR